MTVYMNNRLLKRIYLFIGLQASEKLTHRKDRDLRKSGKFH